MVGMRCKKHPYQAGGGVCATCLRDRLVALEAAQNGDASSPPPPPPAPAQRAPPVPPAERPLAFPRSVSPYVSRRKSDTSSLRHHHASLLFFRTPQVGPTYGGGGAFEEGDIAYEYEKRRARKFSVLATLFGHHHHHHRSEEKHHHQQEAAGAHKERKKRSWLGSSWFAGIIPRRGRKKPQQAPASATSPQSAPPRRSSCRARAVSNRGLSPERDSDRDGSGHESSSSPAAASDTPWRPSPSPVRRTPRRQTSSMPSGFAVCLSPLVRPSPGRSRHRAPVQPPDPGSSFSCELRPSPLHSLSSAASVTRCRSRKLADGGRFR